MTTVNNMYPIILELNGGETNQYPKAVIMNDAGVVQNWFLMSHVTDGCYLSTGWTPTVEDYYHITKQVFTDSGFVTSSSTYGITVELVKVDSIENDVTAFNSSVTWLNTNTQSMGTWLDIGLTAEIDVNETKIDTLTTNVGNLNDISIAQVHSTATWIYQSVTTQIDANEVKIDTAIADIFSSATWLNNTINLPDITDDIATIMSSVSFIWNVEGGKWLRSGSVMEFYEADNATSTCSFNLYDINGVLATDNSIIYRRDRR